MLRRVFPRVSCLRRGPMRTCFSCCTGERTSIAVALVVNIPSISDHRGGPVKQWRPFLSRRRQLWLRRAPLFLLSEATRGLQATAASLDPTHDSRARFHIRIRGQGWACVHVLYISHPIQPITSRSWWCGAVSSVIRLPQCNAELGQASAHVIRLSSKLSIDGASTSMS